MNQTLASITFVAVLAAGIETASAQPFPHPYIYVPPVPPPVYVPPPVFVPPPVYVPPGYPPPVYVPPVDWVAIYNQQVLMRQSPDTWATIQNNHRLQQGQSQPTSSEPPKIRLSTDNPGDWTITGAGAVGAPALGHTDRWPRYDWGGNVISLTSSGNTRGDVIAGGSLAKFDGFWTATCTFTIPKDATGVSLTISDFFADDRAVLELNGKTIGSTGLGAPGDGSMVLVDGTAPITYSFKGPFTAPITTGFNVGGQNIITAVINNTDYGLDSQLQPLDPINGTAFALTGMVFYNQGSPEVASVQTTTSSTSGPAPTPLKIDDIKALTAAGVKPDAIIQAIKESKPVPYSGSDIQAAQQATPPVDPSVIAYMQNPTS